MHFGKVGIRNGYVFEISMARPRAKSGHVPPGTPGEPYVPNQMFLSILQNSKTHLEHSYSFLFI